MPSRGVLSLLALLCIVALGAPLGCAGGNDEAAIRAAVESTQRAFDRGDAGAVCRSLTRAARRHVTLAAHDPPTTCPRDLRLIQQGIRRASGGGIQTTARRVTDVRVDGDRATATVQFGEHASGAVPLAREAGQWKVDALYGGMPARLANGVIERTAFPGPVMPGAGQPTATGGGVVVSRVSEGGEAPCPAVRVVAGGRVTGGCAFRVRADSVTLSVRSLVGDFLFATCALSFTLRVAADGRTSVADVRVIGQAPCNDTYPCYGRDPAATVPLKGRLYRDRRGLRLDTALCFDNCLGRWHGKTEFDVRVRGRRGRAMIDGTLGRSGLEIRGAARVSAADRVTVSRRRSMSTTSTAGPG